MRKNIRKKIREILNEEYFNEIMSKSEKDRLIEILNSLEFKNDVLAAGGQIYAVGGIVRDAIMGTPGDDLDIVVRGIPYDKLFKILNNNGYAKDTSKETAKEGEDNKEFGATIYISRNPKYNKYLVSNGVAKDIDVMLPRKDAKDPNVKGHKGIKSDINPMYTIEDDLQRRDITINAIAMDLNGNIITSGTGLEDIKNGIIRAVNQDSFIEDPLRMLRAVRFAARYNYDWDPATVKLIKDNAYLLSDKEELNWERFLKEFKKMIGKADLSRAVKLIVDLGMYKYIFGIESKIEDYTKFQNTNNVGEMAYMMFDNEPPSSIHKLVERNITNDKYNLAIVDALINYNEKVKTKNFDYIKRVNALAEIFLKGMDKITKTGPGVEVLLNSYYIEPQDKDIANKFYTGEIPVGEHDINFNGDDIKYFISQEFGRPFINADGRYIGKAKKFALQYLYNGDLKNDSDSIKNFLISNKDKWLL